jgi:2-polyprenyl-6-methoxyphenol hydroxylase-like FAD-dependent oxidoreductase
VLPRWSDGRVALLGDAASCVSLFGDGSTLAMAGAFTLAEELAAAPGDPETAFRRYESAHRRLVDPKQRGIGQAAALIVPATVESSRPRCHWLVKRVGRTTRTTLRSASPTGASYCSP